jgi:GPI mannosyltransferase 1 subunit M
MAPRKPPSAARPPGPGGGSSLSAFFASSSAVFVLAALLRAGFLVYGLWQDAVSPVKYTDIDYLVFTDAARFVAQGQSPYSRETYRYTPLLAWLLLPTALTSPDPFWAAFWFSWGKILFAAADLLAGWLLIRILTAPGGAGRAALDAPTARKYASIWLLNPMVITISTRGSSEGLLAALVAALLWAALARRPAAAGLLLGFAVHFKIYPFVYAPAVAWWMDAARASPGRPGPRPQEAVLSLRAFATPARVRLAAAAAASFAALNALMLALHGRDFVRHTFLHHLTRLDHRHNFSPYNTQLYVSSSAAPAGLLGRILPGVESVAFVPQLVLSTVLIPLVMAKKDLPVAMLAQTFAFVAFNKVCTSQVRVSGKEYRPTGPLIADM